MWLDEVAWEAYLDDAPHGSLELPPNVLLRCFAPLAAALGRASLCVLHHADGHARISIRCVAPIATVSDDAGAAEGTNVTDRLGPLCWPAPHRLQAASTQAASTQAASEASEASKAPQTASSKPLMRFPYFAPLLDAIERPLACGLPPQWWLELDANSDGNDGKGITSDVNGGGNGDGSGSGDGDGDASLGSAARAAARGAAASVDVDALLRATALLREALQAQLLRLCAGHAAAACGRCSSRIALAQSLLRAQHRPTASTAAAAAATSTGSTSTGSTSTGSTSTASAATSTAVAASTTAVAAADIADTADDDASAFALELGLTAQMPQLLHFFHLPATAADDAEGQLTDPETDGGWHVELLLRPTTRCAACRATPTPSQTALALSDTEAALPYFTCLYLSAPHH